MADLQRARFLLISSGSNDYDQSKTKVTNFYYPAIIMPGSDENRATLAEENTLTSIGSFSSPHQEFPWERFHSSRPASQQTDRLSSPVITRRHHDN